MASGQVGAIDARNWRHLLALKPGYLLASTAASREQHQR